MAEKKVIDLEVNLNNSKEKIDTLNKSIKNTSDETKKVGDSTKELSSKLDGLTGGAISKFGAFKNSISGVAQGFNGLKVAIISSGIGALAIGIIAIVNAFKRSEEGQNKFAKLMGVIGAVTGQFLDLLADLGEKIIWVFENPKKAINDFIKLLKENIINRFEGLLELIPKLGKAITLLFSGEFAEAGKVAADAVGKVALGVDSITDSLGKASEALAKFAEETRKEAEIAAGIADKRAKADKKERELLVERANANRKIAELREKAADKENVAVGERIKALEEAGRISEEITKKEINAANLRLQAKIAENNLGKSTKEDLEEEAQLRAKVIDLETSKLALQKSITAEVTGARREAEAQRLAELKARQDEIAEFQKQYDELELNNLIVKEEAKTDIIKQGVQNRINAINNELENEKIVSQAQAEIQAARLSNIANGFKLLSQIAGKNKGLQAAAIIGENAVGIAKQVISTRAANAAVTAKYALIPGGVALAAAEKAVNNVSLGLGIATSAAATAKALSALKTSGNATSGISAGGVGGGGASAQAPSFNIVGQSGTNQLAEAIGTQESKPIKAYVTSNDVTTAQGLDRNIVQGATIG